MVEHVSSGIRFGAAVTLNRIDSVLKQAVRDMPEHQTRIFAGIVEMLRWFAGQQIRNVSAVGGNIVTASPISDLNPLFMAANCKLQLAKTGKMREVTIDHTFFTGYRKTILEPDEILLNITVPYTQEDEYFYGYKQAHRREDDISIVNAGCRVVFEPGSTVINRLYLAYGGMAPTTVMALKSMNEAVGKEWNEDLLATMSDSLCEDLPLPPGVPGGSVQYRRTLTLSFFFKFYLSVKQQLHMKKLSPSILPDYESATPVFKKHEFKSSQYYGIVSKEQSITDGVGRPIHHMSAAKQATGEARYIDDIPPFKDELYLALVTSSKAHAEIVNVDTQAALSLPGVHAYIDHNDVMGSNNVGVVLPDELIFAEKKVTCQGQAIGAIVADNQLIAQRAAKLVTVQYKVLKPIISIKDAIAEESYYEPINSFDSGDVDEALMNADHVIDGEMYVGGQEHFYLETHASIAVPTGEDGEMELFSSSQSPTTLQILTASALGVSASRINVRVKRLGGGFGGKESRFIVVALPVAIAAARLNRPVRCMLDRDEDMAITGTRHPYYAKYKVAYSSNGKIEALDIKMYMNAGNSLDLSAGVMERALFHLDNCYKIPKLRAYGYICKTNIPSNTAFRGFGGPQALMVCEAWITQIAERLNLPVHQIRELNFYDKGDITHTCTSMDDSYLQVKRCWTQCLEQSGYLQQKDHIAQFNRENRWKKRGISIIPTKFGIAFTVTFLNQAGALVHVYRDGSVLIAHGGTEMGQGLHTKMIQVASRALNISMNKIHITETSTSTVPNTSPTAASASSDLNGMALVNACSVIMERLKPYIKSKPDKTWDDWVSDAYFDRVSLSSTGFYRTPGISWDWKTRTGNPFNYLSLGAACSVVEIDCLTGDHKVLKTDIVMDVGASLNPAIDIGQIEGAFMQGYGLFTLEEQRFSPQGFLYTRGPGAYKIPGFGDTPAEFNVALLKGENNPRAVYSSKAIGEPPLFLGSSVFFAIKDAINAARADCRLKGTFQMDSPATAERIRMACQDQFTARFPAPEEGTFTPWDIRV
ncbi:xanthine dehydrogenase/oxidase-like isoform X2 [Tubulanus polymorphus]